MTLFKTGYRRNVVLSDPTRSASCPIHSLQLWMKPCSESPLQKIAHPFILVRSPKDCASIYSFLGPQGLHIHSFLVGPLR